MTHFGFDIYTEDFKEPFAGFPYGDHRILDKLWYFDDEYKWPDYDETVAAMLQRNRPGWGFVSLNIKVWGLITTVVMTLACRRRKWAIALGPTVMFVLNFMGQNILGRGSPAAYACAILFPMCGGFASCLTLTITRRLTRIKKG